MLFLALSVSTVSADYLFGAFYKKANSIESSIGEIPFALVGSTWTVPACPPESWHQAETFNSTAWSGLAMRCTNDIMAVVKTEYTDRNVDHYKVLLFGNGDCTNTTNFGIYPTSTNGGCVPWSGDNIGSALVTPGLNWSIARFFDGDCKNASSVVTVPAPSGLESCQPDGKYSMSVYYA